MDSISSTSAPEQIDLACNTRVRELHESARAIETLISRQVIAAWAGAEMWVTVYYTTLLVICTGASEGFAMSQCTLETALSAGPVDVDIGHFLGTYGYREQLVSLRVEFDVLIPFVFLGALRICPRNRMLAYVLYAVASVYLLWATFSWHYYLHHTQVTDKTVRTQRTVVKDFLFVTVASWMSCLFLEFTSLVRFIKHWRVIFPDGQIRWGFNMILPTLTVLCTLNGLYLMLTLHEAVEKSLTSVSEDYYVFALLSLVTVTKGLRQCTESLAFFYRIAQRGFIWRNENDSEVSMIFFRIAFSSLILLIHGSVSTYDFSTQNKPVGPLFLVALCIHVMFRLIVCCWALCNSCCFSWTEHQLQVYTGSATTTSSPVGAVGEQ